MLFFFCFLLLLPNIYPQTCESGFQEEFTLVRLDDPDAELNQKLQYISQWKLVLLLQGATYFFVRKLKFLTFLLVIVALTLAYLAPTLDYLFWFSCYIFYQLSEYPILIIIKRMYLPCFLILCYGVILVFIDGISYHATIWSCYSLLIYGVGTIFGSFIFLTLIPNEFRGRLIGTLFFGCMGLGIWKFLPPPPYEILVHFLFQIIFILSFIQFTCNMCKGKKLKPQ